MSATASAASADAAPGPQPAARPLWSAAALGLLFAVLAGLQCGRPGPTSQWVSDNLQLTLAVACAAACFATAWRERGLGRAFWAFFGAGAATWAGAQAIWTWYARSLTGNVGLELSDVLFFVASAPWVLAAAVRPHRGLKSGLGLAFDAGLLLVLVLHAYLFTALAHVVTGDVASYGRFYLLLMNARALAVVAALVWLMRDATPPWRGAYAHLFAALLVFHVGDALSTQAILSGVYRPGVYDLPWTLPFLWIALCARAWPAGLAPVPAASREGEWRQTRRGTTVALLAVVAVPLLHILVSLGSAADPVLWRLRADLTLLTTVLVGALFLGRQLHLLRRLERHQRVRESALQRSEAQFKTAFHASPAAMSISTLEDGRIIDVNDRYAELVGYAREELLGRTVDEMGLWASALDRRALVLAVEQRRSLRAWPLRFRRKSGELREAVAAYERVEVDGAPCLLGLIEDVTDKSRLEAQLLQSQKMEAIGRLAGGVAHDFNNLLTAILGYGSMLLDSLGGSDPLRRYAQEIERAGERAASLTRQLLTFSRKQAPSTEVVDLGAVVREAEAMLGRLIGEHIRLVTSVAPGLGHVRADAGQLEQVIVNLVVNARDAMPQGGTLGVEARNQERHVLLRVSDTGVGMDAEVKSRLFEPFFTTKKKGQGTGLGLATVYGIVQRSGGEIGVESAPGQGTTFEVRLPRVDDALTLRRDLVLAGAARGKEVLLLVEDDAQVLSLAAEVLEASGYRVLRAQSGPEALTLSQEHRGPIHLVLTDVVLPGMSGPQLAAEITAARPEAKVLFATGHGQDAAGVQLGEAECVQKPFTPQMLARQVRQVLDAPRRQSA